MTVDQGKRQLLSIFAAAGAVGAVASVSSMARAVGACRETRTDISGTLHILESEVGYKLFVRDVEHAFFMLKQLIMEIECVECDDPDKLLDLENREVEGWNSLIGMLYSLLNQPGLHSVRDDLSSISSHTIMQGVEDNVGLLLDDIRIRIYGDGNMPVVNVIEYSLDSLYHAERLYRWQGVTSGNYTINTTVALGICDVYPISEFCDWLGF